MNRSGIAILALQILWASFLSGTPSHAQGVPGSRPIGPGVGLNARATPPLSTGINWNYSNVVNSSQFVMDVFSAGSGGTVSGLVDFWGYPGGPLDLERRDFYLGSIFTILGSQRRAIYDVTEFVRSTATDPDAPLLSGTIGLTAAAGDDHVNGGAFVQIYGRDGSMEYPTLGNTVFEPNGSISWRFENVRGSGGGSGGWIDPPAVSGFTYTMTSDSLFTEIGDFPTGFSQEFTVTVDDDVLGTFGPGEMVDFRSFPGGGVSSFKVTGIEPLVDQADPVGFPLKLDFNTERASFTMVPIPEPSTTVLVIVACVLLYSWTRFRLPLGAR